MSFKINGIIIRYIPPGITDTVYPGDFLPLARYFLVFHFPGAEKKDIIRPRQAAPYAIVIIMVSINCIYLNPPPGKPFHCPSEAQFSPYAAISQVINVPGKYKKIHIVPDARIYYVFQGVKSTVAQAVQNILFNSFIHIVYLLEAAKGAVQVQVCRVDKRKTSAHFFHSRYFMSQKDFDRQWEFPPGRAIKKKLEIKAPRAAQGRSLWNIVTLQS
jgi:hypothetical protein